MTRILMVTVLLAALAAAAVIAATSSFGAGTATREVAVAQRGETAFEFVGKLDQPTLDTVNFYGYITHVAGVPDRALFTDSANRSEKTARLTYRGKLPVDAHLVHPPLFTTTASALVRIYFNSAGGASFDDPDSFARGKIVAVESVRIHNVLAALSETTGIQTSTGQLRQRSSNTFVIGGTTYRFGRIGLRQQLSASGEGSRQLNPVRRTAIAAGAVTVTG